MNLSLKTSKAILSKKFSSTEPLQTRFRLVMREHRESREGLQLSLKQGNIESKIHI